MSVGRTRSRVIGPVSKHRRRSFSRRSIRPQTPGFRGRGERGTAMFGHLYKGWRARGYYAGAHAQNPHAECHRRAVEPQRGRTGRARPDGTRQPDLRGQRLLSLGPAPARPVGDLQAPPGDPRRGPPARPDPRRRRRLRDEGVGDGEGRDPLHALVPAADRLDRGEARLVLRPDRRRRGDRRVLRQGADPGRARRVVVPDRRHPGHVRGPRLHGVGPDLAGLHPREPERRAALHPDRVRVVDGRGARPQDPAAALDGRAVEVGGARAAPARRRRRPRACSPPSGRSRSTS